MTVSLCYEFMTLARGAGWIRRRLDADAVDGAYCHDSCRTQAWSASTILDVLEEMHRIGKGEAK